MTFSLRAFICLLFLLFPVASKAQTLGGGALLQGGPWTQGHSPMYVGQGSSQAIVMDSGPASGGGIGVGLGEQLLVARGIGMPPYIAQGSGPYGTNWCDYDAPTTNPTGYHFLCLSANVHNDAYLAVGPGGTGTPGGLTFNINGIETTYTGAMPTVTSVGADFNTGLITVTNSPITTSGVLHFNVAGNTGGIPYFNSPTSWASTPTLTAGLPLVGGGPGTAPFVASKSGTSLIFANTQGSFIDGDCITVSSGNLIDAGGPCTTGGGGGTVLSSTANNLAYYQSTGTTVTGLATANNSSLVTNGSGVPSWSTTLPTAVQGNITGVGTLTSGTWQATPIGATFGGTGLSSFTSGGLIYAPTTTTLASSAALTSGLPLVGGGVGAAPTTGTKSGPGTKFATTTGSLPSGDCVSLNGSSDFVDSGNPCGGVTFAGTDGGTANAKVISSTGYTLVTDHVVILVASATNTGAATANVNGTGVKSITIPTAGGPVALSGGEITSGNTIALSYDGTNYQLITPPQPSAVEMSAGLYIKYNVSLPNSRVDITDRMAQLVSSTGAGVIRSSVTCTIDALTNGANGLDTGSLAASTFYYDYLISNGSNTACLMSLSSTAPTLPAAYTYKARVGASITDGSSHLIKVVQSGAEAQYLTPVTMASTNTPSLSVTPFIPATSNILRASVAANTNTNSTAAIGNVGGGSSLISGAISGSSQSWTSSGNVVLTSTNVNFALSGTGFAFCAGWVDSVLAY